MKKCLVTGATGFLGKRLVEKLLHHGHDVTVLIRNTACETTRTLYAKWQHQVTISRKKGDAAGIRIWKGDITQINLGVASGQRATDFDHIYHLAAVYDLEADEGHTMATNVTGTAHLLQKLDEDRFSGCLHFVSSIAVAGNFQGEFDERMFDAGQTHDHVYHRSKYLSEEMVRAKRSEGNTYDIRLYRPSAIVGDSNTGEMDRIDGPYYGFVLITALKMLLPPWVPLVLPALHTPLDMVPVDYVAEALYTLSMLGRDELPDDLFCFHLTDPNALSLTNAFKRILKAADGPKVQSTFPIRSGNGQGKALKQALNLKSTRIFRNETLKSLHIPPQIFDAVMLDVRFHADETIRLLKEKGISVPDFDSYADRLWDYYNRHLDPRKTKEKRTEAAFRGKVVLITGGSEGIGFFCAKRCAEYGAVVIIIGRRKDRLDKALTELEPISRKAGGSMEARVCNIADLDDCDRLVAHILKKYGHVDILLNNAALSIRRSVGKSLNRFHDIERSMQTNFFGGARIILGLLPSMVKRQGGHILHSSTMGTNAPTPRFGAYLASKCAMDAYCDSLVAEYTDRNIHFSSIKYPLVKTGMIAPTKEYSDAPAASPEFAAQMFVDAVLDRPRKQMTGVGRFMETCTYFAPKLVTLAYNYIYKIWPDEAGDFPEMDFDRSIIQKFIPHTPL